MYNSGASRAHSESQAELSETTEGEPWCWRSIRERELLGPLLYPASVSSVMGETDGSLGGKKRPKMALRRLMNPLSSFQLKYLTRY